MQTKTNEWQATQATRCKGTITEQHTDEVESILGKEVADRLRVAKEGETFLNVLFQMRK
jgi:hypothetical protein